MLSFWVAVPLDPLPDRIDPPRSRCPKRPPSPWPAAELQIVAVSASVSPGARLRVVGHGLRPSSCVLWTPDQRFTPR
jgi:hypothetical protein